MTADPRADHVLDQWLATQLTALHGEFDTVLDIDAGLADARLPRLHSSLVRALDDVLDIDAGLDCILPTGNLSPTSSPNPSTGSATLRTALGRFAIGFSARPLHERLTTRTWFPHRELVNVRSIARLARQVRDLAIAIAIAGDLARARDLADDLGDAVDRAIAVDRARDRTPNRVRAHDLAGDIVDALTRTHIGALDRVRVCALAVALAQVLEGELGNTLAHTLGLARALLGPHRFDDDLVNVLGDDRGLVHGLIKALNHDRGLVQGLARDPAFNLSPALGHDLFKTLGCGGHFASAARHIDLECEPINRELIDAADRVEQAVTNLTGADLSQVDLRGVPLEGLRWSTGTRWPPGWTDEIQHNSVELEPGLYEIRYGGIDAGLIIDTPS